MPEDMLECWNVPVRDLITNESKYMKSDLLEGEN